jgi:GT2 family glycosyltransferase
VAESVTDIVIPVYNACDDLRRCIDSVRLHTPPGDHCLVLIDDASPDPGIGAYFAELAAESVPGLELLRNPENLGFVATANRGMALRPDRDVLLLNSDTIVTAGWLEKIRRCADSDPRIGTVTPFSNNAEICSFPVFCRDNPLAELPSIGQIAAALASRPPTYPDLPTAVGFCMFIRRRLIDRIGAFDAETFGKGYGEENDFCMRAAAAGFRNVLCDDAFVAHVGGRSFDDGRFALMAENTRRLLARFPEYARLVQDFIAADPLRDIREAAWARLNSAPRPEDDNSFADVVADASQHQRGPLVTR